MREKHIHIGVVIPELWVAALEKLGRPSTEIKKILAKHLGLEIPQHGNTKHGNYKKGDKQ